MSSAEEKKRPSALKLTTPSRSSSAGSSSTDSSLKPPRTPRFAEATTVHSPIDGKGGWSDYEKSELSHAQPADVGFGYINQSKRESVHMPMTPRSPLKSAMKVPGTPSRFTVRENPLSPTFRQEDLLEKAELHTEKEQERDVRIKTRVRMAKFALRGVNFSCSLIIISMISSSFMIFNATHTLPAMNGLPAWSANTVSWPQKAVLAGAAVNLAICIAIFIGYWRGGHHRAQKVGVYYTLFAIGWFIFDMIMWAALAGILQFSRDNSGNQDMWGWSCVNNQRSQLFQDKVDYALVCRLQNWTLICGIIEIVVEVFSIALYSVLFYRYYTKRRLAKSMDMRDRARSDLYLAQLRTQSAPNTPGFGPKSPAFSQYAMSPRFPPNAYKSLHDISENEVSPFTPGGRLHEPSSAFSSPKTAEKPFKLQAPPTKAPSATPRLNGFTTPDTPTAPAVEFPQHAPVAPGEQQYAAVPIPGAYADQVIKSPPPAKTTFGLAR